MPAGCLLLYYHQYYYINTHIYIWIMVPETRVFVQILPRIVFPIYAMVIPETLKFIANNPAPKFRGLDLDANLLKTDEVI